MSRPRLRLDVVRAAELDEGAFVELWRLRGRLIDVQVSVEPADDFAAFRSFFAGAGWVSRIVDEGGALRGFLGWHLRGVETPAGRRPVLDTDYFFIEPELRGHSIMARLCADVCARAAIAHRSARVILVGHGYPSSLLSGARFAERVVFLQDADAAGWEREAIFGFCERFCGRSFDVGRCLVKMRTTPKEPGRTPKSPQTRALLRRFEAHDPAWSEGWGLPYLLHYTPRSLAAGAWRMIRG